MRAPLPAVWRERPLPLEGRGKRVGKFFRKVPLNGVETVLDGCWGVLGFFSFYDCRDPSKYFVSRTSPVNVKEANSSRWEARLGARLRRIPARSCSSC